MKILLTADIHSRKDRFEWLLAQAPQYDLVSIAGDLLYMFAKDMRGQIDYLRGDWLPRMRATGTPLALSSGNHDGDVATWLNYANYPGEVVGDGHVQVLELRSGERLVVLTCPYGRSFNRDDSVMLGLWRKAAALRAETRAVFVALHHEPPSSMSPNGEIMAHWLLQRIREFHPTYVSCGHVHKRGRAPFAQNVEGTWCFNAGQDFTGEAPNHIVLDTATGQATLASPPPPIDLLSGVEERITSAALQ